MPTPEGKTRIAAVADIHVKQTDRNKWVPFFKDVSQHADVLLICGDLTDTGDEEEAKVLLDEMKACTIPIVAVLGNHDYEKGRQKIIRQILQNDHVHILDGEAVVIGDVGFAGVKGFCGGFDKYMLSYFGENAMKAFVQEALDEELHLERALDQLEKYHGGVKKIAVLHYAPIKQTVVGEPEEIFPFLGSSRLAEPLIRKGVIAAFHGHAHVGTLEGTLSNGVKVYNVATPILHKAGYPCPYYLLEV